MNIYFLKIQVLSSAFTKLIPGVPAAYVKMFQKFWCEEYLKFGLLLNKSAKYGFKWLSFKVLACFWAFCIVLFFFCNSISPLGKDLSFLLCLLKLNFVFLPRGIFYSGFVWVLIIFPPLWTVVFTFHSLSWPRNTATWEK